MSENPYSSGSDQLDRDFTRVRDYALSVQDAETALMAGFAYGFATAALMAGRPDLAQAKIEWMATTVGRQRAARAEGGAVPSVGENASPSGAG